jgi:Alanyl-tRNA synthetase
MRVCADHIRAIAFSIADGQLPSNVKAGYVIRRILRRAVRYGYTFLGFTEPFLTRLVPQLVEDMGEAYPELKAQQKLVESVIREGKTPSCARWTAVSASWRTPSSAAPPPR